MAYSGRFSAVNPTKYKGDVGNIIFRSLWEYHTMRWCDLNPDVKRWSSEEIVIPYRCKTDGQLHRYFVDMAIEFVSGKKILVEIKPQHQTSPPKKTKGKKEAKFINETLTYAKNTSKWEAANEWAKKNGYIFQIWTETTLQSIGIMTNITKHPKRVK